MPDLRFFSHNQWNIFSFFDKDHGPRDGTPLRPWVEKAARDKNIDLSGGKIFLLTFPRVFGYVFNPLSVYFCFDAQGMLRGVLHQVKNTFGDQHGYFLPVESPDHIRQECQKVFHVSPFIEMECMYKFRFEVPEEHLNFAIHQFNQSGKMLTATWDGERQHLTDGAVLKTLITHPLLTVKIIVGIHWEALRLWMKGARYIPRPPPPAHDVS